mmetsp:Transcript_22963/g.39397  ORF Transcript_22963/g.39397 Transcript_22963/m.39397 type:complete len:226 (-) Transcript_22963:1834-2511(-)
MNETKAPTGAPVVSRMTFSTRARYHWSSAVNWARQSSPSRSLPSGKGPDGGRRATAAICWVSHATPASSRSWQNSREPSSTSVHCTASSSSWTPSSGRSSASTSSRGRDHSFLLWALACSWAASSSRPYVFDSRRAPGSTLAKPASASRTATFCLVLARIMTPMNVPPLSWDSISTSTSCWLHCCRENSLASSANGSPLPASRAPTLGHLTPARAKVIRHDSAAT